MELSNVLWLGRMEFDDEAGQKRQNARETKAHLEAMLLRTKPNAKQVVALESSIRSIGTRTLSNGLNDDR